MKNKKGVPLSYTNNISYKSVIIYGTNEELKANTDYFLMSSKHDLFNNLVLAYKNIGEDRTKRIIEFYLEIGISLISMTKPVGWKQIITLNGVTLRAVIT